MNRRLIFACGLSLALSFFTMLGAFGLSKAGMPSTALHASADDATGFAASSTPYSQTVGHDLAWYSFQGGANFEVARSVAVDGSGNSYVTGLSMDVWPEVPLRAFSGGTDAFVAKLDGDGNLLWHTFLGGSLTDRGQGIALDDHGNVYVTGFSFAAWGNPIRDHSGNNNFDAFVARLDGDGNLVWHTFLGGSESDQGQSIAIGASGDVYVTGDSHATWGGIPVRAYSGVSDSFVARLSPLGALTWHSFVGGDGSEMVQGITVDSGGDAYVTGYSYASTWPETPVRAGSVGSSDSFVARLGGSGSLAWYTFLGGSCNDSGYDIALDGSGNIYVAGQTYGVWPEDPVRAYIGGPSGFETDGFVARLTPTGVMTWYTFLGGAQYDTVFGLVVDSSGNLFVGGTSLAAWPETPVRPSSGNQDAFAAQLGEDGSLAWYTFLGGSGVDAGWAIAVDSGANLYVAGNSSEAWPEPPARAHSGGYDSFVARLVPSASSPNMLYLPLIHR